MSTGKHRSSPSIPIHRSLFAVGLCLSVLFGATALAADTEQITQWFNDLDHAEAEARETARIDLMGLDRAELDTLRDVVEQNRPLRPSQAAALREIVIHAYLAGEPYESARAGFLGVNLNDVHVTAGDAQTPDLQQQTAVVIVSRVPGFVGYRMLMDGDVVLGVDNHPIARVNDLQFRIGTRGPGETVTLRILRAGAIIQVPVTLDARPSPLEQVDELRQTRERDADNYWQRTFAPLLQERISTTPPSPSPTHQS